jgi:hypothetical protein
VNVEQRVGPAATSHKQADPEADRRCMDITAQCCLRIHRPSASKLSQMLARDDRDHDNGFSVSDRNPLADRGHNTARYSASTARRARRRGVRKTRSSAKAWRKSRLGKPERDLTGLTSASNLNRAGKIWRLHSSSARCLRASQRPVARDASPRRFAYCPPRRQALAPGQLLALDSPCATKSEKHRKCTTVATRI